MHSLGAVGGRRVPDARAGFTGSTGTAVAQAAGAPRASGSVAYAGRPRGQAQSHAVRWAGRATRAPPGPGSARRGHRAEKALGRCGASAQASATTSSQQMIVSRC
jgi:hypothetical protein